VLEVLLGLAAGAMAAGAVSGAGDAVEPTWSWSSIGGRPPAEVAAAAPAWGWSFAGEQIGAATVQGKVGRLSVPEAQALIQGGLVGLNRYQLRVMGVPPISQALHEGRVVYDKRDDDEHWMSIREIWEAGDGIRGPRGVGRGDCEDLAAALAAELCEAGEPAEVVIVKVRPGLSHAVVRVIRTGELMDPSKTGGMGWEAEHRARFGLSGAGGRRRGGNVSTPPGRGNVSTPPRLVRPPPRPWRRPPGAR
jgi:hypothetical protein